MRNMARLTVLLAVTTAPLTAQGLARDELPIRSWSVEMRDKAETSLYERRDCASALLQANAAYDRAKRHPERMDPRIPLVKARAHDCLGQLPAAIAAYGLHDQLAGLDVATDPGFQGACRQLSENEAQPADSAARVARQQELIAHARALQATMDVAVQQAGNVALTERRDRDRELAERQLWTPGDGVSSTASQQSAMYPRYQAAWTKLPPRNRYGYPTSEGARTRHAVEQFEVELADTQARLLCLAVLP